MTIQSLYNFGNAANVSANNFTTLYNDGASVVNPQMAYGNAEVVALLNAGTDGSNTISNITATGNVVASNVNAAIYATGYFYANGAPLNITGNYSNANVAAFLPVYTGNIAGNTLSLTNDAIVSGNITTGQTITAGGDIQSNGNIRTLGVSGNITGVNFVSAQYYLGNGSQLTGLPATYSNANVATLLASFGSNSISTTGNVTSSYFFGNGSQLTGLPATYGNANVVTLLANFGSNSISTTGNITSSYVFGNGSQLTGLPATYGNANVAAFLPTYTGDISAGNISTTGNVTVSGNLFSDDITSTGVTVYGDQVITGNLTVQGNTTTINSNVITTNDKTITVANNQSTGANVNGAGLEAGNPAIATWYYNDLTTSWQSNIGITPTGNLSQDLGGTNNRWATVYAGDGILSGNVTANYFIGNGATLTSINASNVTGTVANAAYATTAGTASYVTANAQANITSVGTLTSLSVSGNINTGNLVTGGLISAVGNVTGNYFVGNGYTLTSVNGSNVQGDVTSALNASTLRIPVKNTSGGTLTLGTPIYATGTVGSTDTLEIAASRADTAGTMAAVGLLETTLGINATGYAVSIGALGGFDTSTYAVGQELYVAATGGITGTRPTGSNVVQTVGTVGRVNASTGTIEVNIWDKNPLPNLGSGNIWLGNASAFPTETALATYSGTIGAGTLSVSGNTTTGNLLTGGLISATGNVTGSLFIGNGAALTNITASNVTGTVANATYATSAGTATTATSAVTATVANTVSDGAQANITSVGTLTSLSVSGNVNSGNVLTGGVVSATGNITGNYIFGNGSQLTGIAASYGNANVVALLSAFGSNVVSTTGNITAGYFIGNGSQLTGITAVSSSNAFGNISVTGQTTVAANTASSTLQLVAGTNITITTDAANAKITITSTAAGGETLSPFLLMGG